MAQKVDGFNPKEQKILNKLADGKPHDIREMKRLFWNDARVRCKEVYDPGWGEDEVDAQAQSYVRNSIRRLIRDGWAEQCDRGTYRLTRTGKNRVEKGVTTTPSKSASQRGKASKPKKKKATKKKTTKKKTTKKTKTKAKTKSKKAKTKTKAKSNGSSRAKVSKDKVKAMRTKAKVAAAKEKFAQASE